MGELPKRSAIIMEIDSNGHIGRDATCSAMGNGATKWTPNGQSLWDMCNERGLVMMNTLNNCRDAGWTWNRRDGKFQTRVDYVCVSRELVRDTKDNLGAMSWESIHKTGQAIDHRPVGWIGTIRLLHQRGHQGAHGECTSKGVNMSSRNVPITKAYREYEKVIANQFKKDIRTRPVITLVDIFQFPFISINCLHICRFNQYNIN
jgi:hypothetical protein